MRRAPSSQCRSRLCNSHESACTTACNLHPDAFPLCAQFRKVFLRLLCRQWKEVEKLLVCLIPSSPAAIALVFVILRLPCQEVICARQKVLLILWSDNRREMALQVEQG